MFNFYRYFMNPAFETQHLDGERFILALLSTSLFQRNFKKEFTGFFKMLINPVDISWRKHNG
jgi:hypothetical protein